MGRPSDRPEREAAPPDTDANLRPPVAGISQAAVAAVPCRARASNLSLG